VSVYLSVCLSVLTLKGKLLEYRARQLCKNISMLFLFLVKHSKLSTGAHISYRVTVSLR